MLSEQWGTLKRTTEAAIKRGIQIPAYDPSRPWESIVSMCVQRGNLESFEWWSTRVDSLIGKITRDGGTASQAATALGLDPCDFQTRPAYSQPYPGNTKGRERPTQPDKEVTKPFLKDKGRGKHRSKGKRGMDKNKKDKGNTKQQTRERYHNWNRAPDGCTDPCPNDRDHTCEKCGGHHCACNCTASSRNSWTKWRSTVSAPSPGQPRPRSSMATMNLGVEVERSMGGTHSGVGPALGGP